MYKRLSRFLEIPTRPVPQDPTHYVMVEVLNRDLSIKRVTIYFSSRDEWGHPAPPFFENERNAGHLIADGLTFLGRDEAALAWKASTIDIATGNVVQCHSVRTKEILV